MNYDITAWLKNQPIWIQEATIRLELNGKITDGDINEFVTILKGDTAVVPNLSLFKLKAQNIKSLKLISIDGIKGIEKLKPRSPLIFGGSNLSVIYGRNGSGKSGYTRILKKLSGKSSDSLMANVYDNTPEAQACKVDFYLDSIPLQRHWAANDDIIEPLSEIDFFDNSVSDYYLQQENEASYAPQEMIVFAELSSVCERVMELLDAEKSKLVSTLPKLPAEFNETMIGKKYQGLSYKISPAEVEKITSFSEDSEKTIQLLRERLSVKDPVASAKKQRDIQKQIESIKTSIENRLVITTVEFRKNLHRLYKEATKKRQAVKEGASVLRGITKLPGVGQETWKSLWEAARIYSTTVAYPTYSFPNVGNGSHCLLCHQELNEEAKKRLLGFDDFVQGTLEKEAKTAEQAFETALKDLPKIVAEADVIPRFQAAGLDEILCKKIWIFIDQINILIEKLRSKDISIADDQSNCEIQEVVQDLSKLSKNTEEKAVQFEKDAKSFDKKKTQEDLVELEAQQWVSQQRDAVFAEVELKKRIRRYDDWKSQTNTRFITSEAGKASEILLTEAYITRFNTELQKLGATGISVELMQSRNIKGRGRYRVQLKNAQNSVKPTNILSDGEKRIIALAAFLADVTGREANVPFIFDDPISSLDQDFEEKTIYRLIELSNSRQVIIFTHRLSFLSIITDRVDDESLTTTCINCEQWGTGEPSDVPINAKNPKKVLNKLYNERLPQAQKVLTDKGQEIYNIHAQSICSNFRKLIERIVEIVLLADIVQRHRRAIKTMNKIHNLAKIKPEDCALIDEMMTKYSCYEHSQSSEAPVQLPLPDELTSDIKRVIDWQEEFSKRQV